MKVIATGKKAREAMWKGINAHANIVESTIGPAGKNVLIGAGETPIITNDGVSISKVIQFENEFENEAAKVAAETAKRTNDRAGDGTTTATVLGRAIFNTAYALLGGNTESALNTSKVNSMNVMRDIEDAQKTISEELIKMATPISSEEDIIKVANVSVENKQVGELIGKLIYTVGKESYITVEDGTTFEVETEILSGIKIQSGYAHRGFINAPKNEAIRVKTKILLTDQHITSISQIAGIINELHKNGENNLVIVAPEFTAEVLTILYADFKSATFNTLPVKAPYIRRDEYMEDLAILTGGVYLKDSVKKVADVTVDDLGQCEKVIARNDTTAFIDGKGTEIEAKTKELEEALQSEKSEWEKGKIRDRIGRIKGKVGTIRVGAHTEQKRKYLKDKIEDCVNAVKAAMEEGVVKGGGLALKEISEKLSKNILSDAILAPYKAIQRNAGGTLEIGEDIIDPVKVTRTALDNACSIGSLAVTIDTLIVEKREDKCCHKNTANENNQGY